GSVEACAVGITELGVVPGGEELSPKFDRLSLRNVGLLQQREVPIGDSGTAHDSPSHGPVSEHRAVRAIKVPGAAIKVRSGGSAQGIAMRSVRTRAEGAVGTGIVEDLDRPENVRTIEKVVLLTRIDVVVDGERISRLKSENPTELPT